MAQLTVVIMLSLALTACLGHPPPVQRALESNELCVRYMSEGDLERAEIQCDLGISFSPEYADLYVNKGLIAMRRGQLGPAKDLFVKALRLNQEQAQAYNNLGVIYLGELGYGKAHDNFRNALKVNPDYAEARFNLGLALKGLHEPEKARIQFKTLTEIQPNLSDPTPNLGNSRLRRAMLKERSRRSVMQLRSTQTSRAHGLC